MASTFESRLGITPNESVKAPVVAASTANLTLSGLQTIDSFAVTEGQRVLAKNQTDASQNGPWNVSSSAWTRPSDWDSSDDVTEGVLILDHNSGILYYATFAGSFSIGTTEVSFVVAPTNQQSLVSSNDSTAGNLEAKIQPGAGVLVTVRNEGGNETLDIDTGSLASIGALDFSGEDGESVTLVSFHPDLNKGGGAIWYDPNQDTANHNGIDIIDHRVIASIGSAAMATWSSATQTTYFTAVAGNLGCWKRITGDNWSPEIAGAKFNNSDDIAKSVNKMLEEGMVPVFPPEQCVVDSTINILDNTTIVFNNARIRNITDTAVIFSASTVNNWALLGRARITGTLTLGGGTAETAVQITDCRDYVIENITAELFKGWGFRVLGGVVTTDRARKGRVNNCSAYECFVGWELEVETGGEYTVITGCNAVKCADGVIVAAGNTNWTGGNIVDCTGNGIKLESGGNHGHGSFTGVNINHNNVNLRADDIEFGYTFTGCHWYGDSASLGKIVIVNSKGIDIDGGDLDSVVEVLDGAATKNGLNLLRNMKITGSNAALSGDDLVNLRSYGHYDFAGQEYLLYTRIVPTNVSSFSNSWVNHGSGRSDAGYYLTESGECRLVGAIKDGTMGLVAFTLPVGYRPPATIEIPVVANNAYGDVLIQTDGQVFPITGSNAKFYLEGASFQIVDK